jgi:hypothetical protein
MTQDTGMSQQDDERRRFFRIEDSVHMSLRAVRREELDQSLQGLEGGGASGSFSLMTRLNMVNQQVSASLRRIESRDPDVADYLKALDRKLDILAKAFLAEEVDITDKPARAVNLSAGGMAVHSRDSFEADTVVEIKMLLLPSYSGVLTYGTVVDCRPLQGDDYDADYPYLLRIDFSFMRDADRDALIRHVLLKQAEWLRRRREERELREG